MSRRAALAAALALVLSGCQREPLAIHSFSKELMRGTWELQVVCRGQSQAEAAVDAACAEVARLDAALTPWQPGSELALANASAGSATGITLSADLSDCLQLALAEAEASQGAYDPSAGPLNRAWWQSLQDGQPLGAAARQRGLALQGWRQVRLDPGQKRLWLPRAGMGLDLSGLAKGYAQDQAALILKAHGIKSFLLNAGGQVYATGRKPDGSAWRVGILDPRDSSKVAATLALEDEVLSTHGDDSELSAVHGATAPRTMDPRTGLAVKNGLASVTAILPWDPKGHAGLMVEAASLSAFILGPAEGLHLLGAQSAQGLLIAHSGGLWRATVSPGLRPRLQPADSDIAFPDINAHP